MSTHNEAVLTSTHNLCFDQKYVKYRNFLSENFHFLVVKFSVYLNRHVFVMFYQLKSTDIFLISPQKHMLWYSLDAPHQGHLMSISYPLIF